MDCPVAGEGRITEPIHGPPGSFAQRPTARARGALGQLFRALHMPWSAPGLGTQNQEAVHPTAGLARLLSYAKSGKPAERPFHNTNRGARSFAPWGTYLDFNLGWSRASQRTESQRRAVDVARVGPALLRGSSMEVLQRLGAQAPAERGHEGSRACICDVARSRLHTHTRRWHALRA